MLPVSSPCGRAGERARPERQQPCVACLHLLSEQRPSASCSPCFSLAQACSCVCLLAHVPGPPAQACLLEGTILPLGHSWARATLLPPPWSGTPELTRGCDGRSTLGSEALGPGVSSVGPALCCRFSGLRVLMEASQARVHRPALHLQTSTPGSLPHVPGGFLRIH